MEDNYSLKQPDYRKIVPTRATDSVSDSFPMPTKSESLTKQIAKCLSPGLLPGQDMFEEEGYFFIKPERRLEIARLILTLINDKPSPASVKEIEDLIYKSPGWNLAKGSREEKELARQLLSLRTPELTLKKKQKEV
jgi:hypothetical protein